MRGAIIAAVLLSAPLARAAPVSLEFWTIDQDQTRQSQVFAAEFNKLHSDIRIDVKHVDFADVVDNTIRAIASGSGPDIVTIDNPEVAIFASHGAAADLSPMIAKSSVIKLDDLYPGPRASVTWKGGVYGMPRGNNTLALFINDDAFRAHGLDPDHPPATWDELRADGLKLTDPAHGKYGLAFSAIASEEGTFQFLPFLQSAGGDWRHVDSPAGVAALTFWQSLLDDRIASRDTLVRRQTDSFATFTNGDAAMAISGPWELPDLSKGAHFHWRVALLPVAHAGAREASALGEHVLLLPRTSTHQAQSFEFLEYVYAHEDRDWNEFGMLPSMKLTQTPAPRWPEAYATFIKEMGYARVRGPDPNWPRISKAIQTAIQSALTHEATPKQALGRAQSEIDGVEGG
jgi:multiple sugar transport system substrate-binding protein